jgi:hypothetical protein
MSDSPKHSRANFRSSFVGFSVFLVAFYWLVVATYPEFFIFNPFDEPSVLRQITLLISIAGWLVIAIVPGLALFFYAAGNPKLIALLPFAALLWPLSVVLNQVVLYARDSVWYFDYLVNSPVFIATDILLPALLIFIWQDLKEREGRHEALSQKVL